MFTLIARIILRNRVAVLVILALVTAFYGFQATKVNLSYEPASLVPRSDSVLIEYERYREIFGEDGNILVIGVRDPDFFRLDHFENWLDMKDSLLKLDGVKDVISIASAYNIVRNNEIRKFEVIPLLSERPGSQAAMDTLETLIRSLPFYRDVFYNEASNTYLLLLPLETSKMNSKIRHKLIGSLENATNHFASKKNLEVHYSGIPYIRIKSAEVLERELYMFVMFAIIITGILLFLFFRSFRVVFFSLLVVLIGVIWSLGFMGLVGYEITILTAVIPPLIIVIGIPNSIFLLNKYHIEFRRHGNKIKALQRVIQKIGAATFLTNLTTAAGFATFILTSTRILREFGVVAAVNIMGIFVLSLCLIPIFFSFLPSPNKRHIRHLENRRIHFLVGFFEKLSGTRRTVIYYVSAGLVIMAFVGISFIKSTGYIVDDLPKHHPISRDLDYFETQFSGLIPLEISIDTKRKRGAMTGPTIQRIEDLQNALSQYPELSRPLSIAEAIKFARQAFFNGAPHQYKLPSNTERNFIFSYLGNLSGQSAIAGSFIDSASQVVRISYKVADLGSQKTQELEKNIREEVAKIFPEEQYSVVVTGASILAAHGNKYLTRSLFTSLFIAVFAIAIFMAWMFSSREMVVISMIPNLIPLLITASLMGYFGITIKPSTVLVFSIAFGISVDNTIHFLAKYRQELKFTGYDIGRSVRYAIREAGISMLYTSIVLFFGFGIFAFSSFGGTVALGVLVSFTLLVAVTSNLILLPSMLLTWEKRRFGETFKEPLMQIYDEEAAESIPFEDLSKEKDSA